MEKDRRVRISERNIVECKYCGKRGLTWLRDADDKLFLAQVRYHDQSVWADPNERHGADNCPEYQKMKEQKRVEREARYMIDRGKWQEYDCQDCHDMIPLTEHAKLRFALEVKVKDKEDPVVMIHISNGAGEGERHFAYCGKDVTDEQIVDVTRIDKSKIERGKDDEED